MTSAFSTGSEPIPGYVLRDRIGAGGCGEVWVAKAPGGLLKAVKIVFGNFDESRAELEWRALNRMKSVRHPFLLSLERIECVDSRLLVVTELADGSVQDRFRDCRAAGHPGIPREELLGYMRDAAEGLDFLVEKFGLQHLDVKPENLLLLAGRIKVADFGLVKEIKDRTNVSQMGGLTPRYAAPEVFHGRPSLHSDQYSLAVLYYELLTGKAPFSGSGIAELTNQHLHARPDVRKASRGEQVVLQRALSKDPQQRHASSRAFVAALTVCEREDFVIRPAQGSNSGNMGPVSDAAQSEAEEAAASRRQKGCGIQRAAIPIQLTGGPLRLRPTLLIGVGGLAHRVLSHLENRLTARFGADKTLPSLQMLLIDTDPESLFDSGDRDVTSDLVGYDTLELSLKPPHEYRAMSARLLRTISRRWIYNVPRSLRTEGMRPFGRLAIVEQFAQTRAKLATMLKRVMNADNIKATAANSGCDISLEWPRVFVLASSSGGTGSGMSIDLGYHLRTLLSQMGLSQDGLCGVFLHASPPDVTGAELAVANSVSLLRELYNFNRPGGTFPGDAGCGLPEMALDHATFRHMYFVNVGHTSDPEEFDRSLDHVAGYLFQNVASQSSEFFDECRRLGWPHDGVSEPFVRGFSAKALEHSPGEVNELGVHMACRRLFSIWTDDPRKIAPSESSWLADQTQCVNGRTMQYDVRPAFVPNFASWGLTTEALLRILFAEVPLALNMSMPSYVAALVLQLKEEQAKQALPQSHSTQQGSAARHKNGEPPAARPQPASDAGIPPVAASPVGAKLPEPKVLMDSLRWAAMDHTKKIQQRLLEHVSAQLESPGARWSRANLVQQEFDLWLQNVATEAQEMSQRLNEELIALRAKLMEPVAPGSAPSAVDPLAVLGRGNPLYDFVDARLSETAFNLIHGVLEEVKVWSKEMRGELDSYRDAIGHLEQQFPLPSEWENVIAAERNNATLPQDYLAAVSGALRRVLPSTVQRFDEQMLESGVLGFRKFTGMLKDLGDGTNKVRDALKSELTYRLRWAQSELSLLMNEDGTVASADSTQSFLKSTIESTLPTSISSTTVARLLVVLPEGINASACEQVVTDSSDLPVSILCGGKSLFVCYETEQIRIRDVAAFLAGDRQPAIDLSTRLQTRADIVWDPILATEPNLNGPALSGPQTSEVFV